MRRIIGLVEIKIHASSGSISSISDTFWRLAHQPEYVNKRLDLIEGVIYEMPLAGFEQGVVSANLLGLIGIHVRANDLGLLLMTGTGFVVHTDPNGKDTILAPDVGFIAKARIPAEPVKQYAPLAPDLAVEVVSPNDSASDVHVKVNKYLQYGTPVIWVVYPATRTVVVHTAAGAQTLDADDTLDGGDILPGFALRVGDIFSFSSPAE